MNDRVNTVDEVRVTTSVRPVGTPVNVYCVPLFRVATYVSLASVIVRVWVMEPLLAVASGNDVPE